MSQLLCRRGWWVSRVFWGVNRKEGKLFTALKVVSKFVSFLAVAWMYECIM